MAGQSARKVKASNTCIIYNLNLGYLIVIALYALHKLIYGFPSWTYLILPVLINALNLFLAGQLRSIAQKGGDLQQKGMIGYYFDVIYIGWIVLLGSCLSGWFYQMYWSIPAYAAWKLWGFVIVVNQVSEMKK